jgi:hypothetical protein
VPAAPQGTGGVTSDVTSSSHYQNYQAIFSSFRPTKFGRTDLSQTNLSQANLTQSGVPASAVRLQNLRIHSLIGREVFLLIPAVGRASFSTGGELKVWNPPSVPVKYMQKQYVGG